MAVGKNKGLSKSKKGIKKKIVDPFSRKDWYDVKAPGMFKKRIMGKTPVNRTTGTKLASDSLKGRVFEISLGDLSEANAEFAHRKFKFISEEVDDRTLLTNFYGMTLTTDNLKSLVKKHQTTIEAFVDVKTTDSYLLRLFCIGFTDKPDHQIKKTAYATSAQSRAIRKKMIEIIVKEITSEDLKSVINKLIPDSIAKDISRICSYIFPLKDVAIRKVKVLKKPRLDLHHLKDMHMDTTEKGEVSRGEIITQEGYEPAIQESV